jgi:zinc transport system substrate-binding protein
MLHAKSAAAFALAAALLTTGAAAADGLRVGITLHPYYSFVANIVGDRAEIVPLIDANANPHGYMPQAADMIRITTMDVLVVNGIGHDSWAFEILDAAGVRDTLTLIYANDGVSLIPVAGDPSGARVVNPHTFISTTAAIQQVYTIARQLGELDPDNATFFRNNARQYALEIRRLRSEFDARIVSRTSAARRCIRATTTSSRSSASRSRP